MAGNINDVKNTVNKGIDDASKIAGQTISAGADLATGDAKGALSHVSSAANAAKDTAVDAATAGTDIAGDAAGAIGMNSIKKGLDTVSNATGSIVNSAGDAALHGAAAAAKTTAAAAAAATGHEADAKKLINSAGHDAKSSVNAAADAAVNTAGLATKTIAAGAGAMGAKSVANTFNKVGLGLRSFLLFVSLFLCFFVSLFLCF